MATFNKFNSFITAVAAGTHAGFINASTDVVNVYLTDVQPSASLDALKADIAEIATGGGYTGPVDIQNAASQTGTTITVTATDVTITASGTVAQFQWAVIYNETAAGDPLIGWYEYPSKVNMTAGETFKVDFGASLLTLG